jgi:signal transduction histidine kinase
MAYSDRMVLDAALEIPTLAGAPEAARVLVLDDEEPVLLTVKGILELDGYHVVACDSGEQALDLMRSQPFDVLLTDLRVDEFNGLDILRELRMHNPNAVGILLTGYASLETAVQALRQGAYDYLFKPCDVIELRATVARGVERSRLASQLQARVRDLEHANETIRALNLELEQRVEAATAELREQISARDEFMATVSHDLKSPLTFIKGMASLRRRRASRTPETMPLVDALEHIESSASRMAQQLDELVDAARLEAGRPIELRRDTTDLLALARQAVAEHQQTTDRHVLRVEADVSELVGYWDEPRLARVLDNLLGNAIKYSPRGGAIQVQLALEDDDQNPGQAQTAVLHVRDRGEGIPAADLPHIFERFHRGGNVEGRIPGTGIGLAGVRSIVELHNGRIDVDSAVGYGTTVTVRLPLEV